MDELRKITGNSDSYFLEVTTPHTGKRFYGLSINTDAVFTTLIAAPISGVGPNIDVKQDSNYTARTVSQGQWIPAPTGYYITNITMSSGDAIGYELI